MTTATDAVRHQIDADLFLTDVDDNRETPCRKLKLAFTVGRLMVRGARVGTCMEAGAAEIVRNGQPHDVERPVVAVLKKRKATS